MMKHLYGKDVGTPSAEPSTMNMGMMLQQLASNSGDQVPKCKILRSAGSQARALWQNELNVYDYEVWKYRQSHPWYVPDLSKWVEAKVWRDISEDLLESDDQTDGGPPNDIATESLLRHEGRYAGQTQERGKVQHANTLKELQNIQWTAMDTHVESYEEYIHAWKRAKSTMFTRQIPPQEMQCKAMVNAVQPADMQERIKTNMWAGLGPYELSTEFQKWRLTAGKNVKMMRKLIREHCDHWDLRGWKPVKTSKPSSPPTTGNAPTCASDGCSRPTVRKRRGKGGHFKYCPDHKHLEQWARTPAPASPVS